jgi:predicted AlkP superfamily pyrophosphatase or phosphodiesterase
LLCSLITTWVSSGAAQQPTTQTPNAHVIGPKPERLAPAASPARPKLVVLIVVDQMRGDYVDKFRGQWTGGLQRLLREGAWYREAAYPYAATETCVGHATISTGSFPATHGIIANAWWDRESQKMVTCTSDPNSKDIGYAGVTPKGGDSAWRIEMPSFAEELKFQTGDTTRIVSFSLKARAAISMAGHKGDAVAWFDHGGWATSSVYGTQPFIEEYAKAHPIIEDYGKTWSFSMPKGAYLYQEKATGAVPPRGWTLSFPHALRGEAAGNEPDVAFYEQWAASPYADAYLTHMAETSVDSLHLGNGKGTDFVAIGYSSLDYVGHAFGPRSWEVQDLLVRLDKDLAQLFAQLDEKVGRGKYVVALTADHGVVPVPEDMQATGTDAGVLHMPELQQRLEQAVDQAGLPKHAIARISGTDVYFTPEAYQKLVQDPQAMHAIADAALAQPGVAEVYWSDQLKDRPATQSPIRDAMADSYFRGRSGDLFIVPKPYWLMDSTPAGKARSYGTSHGTPYYYDQHVPILLMGYSIQHGEFLREVTPADIAPTLALLSGITLASRDGHVLTEAVSLARQPTPPPSR